MADGSEQNPTIRDALALILRRLTDRGRAEVSRAATRSRERLELRQLHKDRDHFWARLGKEAYNLVAAGEIDHPGLRKAMARIDELEARIAAVQAHGDAPQHEVSVTEDLPPTGGAIR